MRNRITRFLRDQLDRVESFTRANGWELLRKVENSPDRNCGGTAVDAFFPTIDEYDSAPAKLAERKKIEGECRGCPVADECLAGALLRGERFGGWGGVAQPDFQALGRAWRRLHPAVPERSDVDRSRCTASRHGDNSAYRDGCRCEDARQAHRRYQRQRSAQRSEVRSEVA